MSNVCLDLSQSDCGVENDEGFETKFCYGEHEVGDKNQNMMVLNASDATEVGGRLCTQYFEMGNRKHAILVVEYFMDGEGANSLAIIKQDSDNSEIWKTKKKSDSWRKVKVCFEAPSDPRFFIEARVEPGSEGTVAISKIKVVYCRCCHCECEDE